MPKPKKTYQKQRTKSKKLTKSEEQKSEKLTRSEEQLIINLEVLDKHGKKLSYEDQILKNEVWIKM